MTDFIFCKIITREVDSAKICEDKECLAILDIMANTIGMALILIKKHYDSYAFDVSERYT